MIDLQAPEIVSVEKKILLKYEQDMFGHRHFDEWLKYRKRAINEIVLKHQEEILQDIIDFDDALKEALRELYERAHSIWDNMKDKKAMGDDVELTACCFLDYEYPKLHPIQGEDREDLWSILCDDEWNPIYFHGCSLAPLRLPNTMFKSYDEFIGMDSSSDNWNYGLDRELTKDLHLTSAFHNLYDHTNFAITDFIYVRKFQTEINIEISKKV